MSLESFSHLSAYNLINKMLIYLISLSLTTMCATAHQNPNFQQTVDQNRGHPSGALPTKDGVPQGLWDQYGRHDFMHDLNHLKEEANKLLYLQESDQITNDQSAFYYTKLHDFNSDAKLDGLELLLAVRHSLVHQNASYEFVNLEDLSGYVDSELSLMDQNNDGFVDYGEIYMYMENNKQNRQNGQNANQ